LSLLSLAALCWAVRDALAWQRLGRALATRARPDGAKA
jgi:hypothetical protein